MKYSFRRALFGIALACCLNPAALHASTPGVIASSEENPQLPTVPFSAADGTVNANIGSESSSINYRGDEQWLSAELGLGYYNPAWGNGKFNTHLGMATMLSDSLALGILGDYNVYKRDLVLNSIWQTPIDGFRMKLSGGYMWGKQEFDFGTERAFQDLGQFSWVASGEYVVSDSGSSLGLHSLGMSTWGARANDRSGDSYELSEGRLFGISANTQLGILNNLVANGSVGYEELDFPVADAANEKNENFYTDLGISWEPFNALSLEAGWKNGVSEDRFSIGASSGPVKLSSWYSQGHAELYDEKGITLAYTYDFGNSTMQNKNVALADRKKPHRIGDNQAQFLAEAMSRPMQMPTQILAKTDGPTVNDETATAVPFVVSSATFSNDTTKFLGLIEFDIPTDKFGSITAGTADIFYLGDASSSPSGFNFIQYNGTDTTSTNYKFTIKSSALYNQAPTEDIHIPIGTLKVQVQAGSSYTYIYNTVEVVIPAANIN